MMNLFEYHHELLQYTNYIYLSNMEDILSTIEGNALTREEVLRLLRESAKDLIAAFENICEADGGDEDIGDEPDLPSVLLHPSDENIPSFKRFVEVNDCYTQQLEIAAAELLKDLDPGLKHHSIHVISNNVHWPSVIGMNQREFGILFSSIYDDLHEAFPNCPMTLEKGMQSVYCEN